MTRPTPHARVYIACPDDPMRDADLRARLLEAGYALATDLLGCDAAVVADSPRVVSELDALFAVDRTVSP